MAREEVRRCLKRHGLRVTGPREVVLQYLWTVRTHPTAEEIGNALAQQKLRISRASVYNVLNSLLCAGLIQEVTVDGLVTRFDANTEHHHHFVCRACGSVSDIPLQALPESRQLHLGDGSVVEEVSITLRGRCGGCAGSPVPAT
jgi:Fe2+ or Zn2+ uptake regulation protein